MSKQIKGIAGENVDKRWYQTFTLSDCDGKGDIDNNMFSCLATIYTNEHQRKVLL